MALPPIPNFGALLGDTLASIPDPARPGFLAQLERTAADRYRDWADQREDLAEGLRRCAAREDEIAARAEKLLPVPDEHREAIEKAIPKARALYSAAFEGYSIDDQLIIQAHAERQGAIAWLAFAAAAGDPSVAQELRALADLEIETAAHLDETLGITSTGRV